MKRLVLLLSVLLSAPAVTLADDDWYGIASVVNGTNGTIYYVGQYAGGEPEPKSIEPGVSVNYWHRYNYPNEHSSPTLTISFPTQGVWKTRSVTRKGESNQNASGFRYFFRYAVTGAIELYPSGDGGVVNYQN